MALCKRKLSKMHFVQILNETAKAVEEKDNPSHFYTRSKLGLL